MNFSAKASLPPLVQTHAKVVERDAIGIKTLAVGSVHSDKLGREVQHLTELCFASAQSLLCSFALSDVDYSSCEFDEIARGAENRMTNAVNVPDGATRMHNAIIDFFVGHFMLGPPGRRPKRRLIVGMNSLDEFFGSGQTIPRIKAQNAVGFLRPMPDVGVGSPGPTARVAQPLRFRQVRFTAPEGFLCRLTLGDFGHRPDKLAIAGCILHYMSQGMDVLDSPVRQQQAILLFEISACLGCAFDDLLSK